MRIYTISYRSAPITGLSVGRPKVANDYQQRRTTTPVEPLLRRRPGQPPSVAVSKPVWRHAASAHEMKRGTAGNHGERRQVRGDHSFAVRLAPQDSCGWPIHSGGGISQVEHLKWCSGIREPSAICALSTLRAVSSSRPPRATRHSGPARSRSQAAPDYCRRLSQPQTRPELLSANSGLLSVQKSIPGY